MSDICKDLRKIWSRLFDHKAFLNGETDFILKEFELKRGDQEVDSLFRTLENIAEIKDSQIDQLKEANVRLWETNQNLREAVNLTKKLNELEDLYKQNSLVEEEQNKRKLLWDKFMDEITSEYSKVNREFEEQEIETLKFYEDLKKKLVIQT
ncbi:biogenesis of lysosome-related organelles complex 1 subunit 5 [Cylas formicarius]|uniref:biogenesis of lysosome-related organelles complex 1 subunit 5 n=1 Tax=Cylas formicarius TaxID=197179 RepID=UPI0029587E1D|nr:biogenesis of lysosome-related organelles complex 1 subunit 5 [Cylas formicarius]